MHRLKKVSVADWLNFLGLTLIWGSSFILMKKGMDAFSAPQVAAMRIFIAGIVLSPFAYLKRADVRREQLFPIIIMGVFGSGIPAFLFTAAETQISSSLAGILNALMPVFVLLLGILFFRQKHSSINTLGIIIGFAGCAALIWFENKVGFSEAGNWYALLVVLAALLYGISNLVIIHYLQNTNALTITSVAFAFMCPVAGAYLFTTDLFSVFQNHPLALPSFFYICILSILGTAVSWVFYNQLISRAGGLFASTVTYLMPVVAVIWGIIAGEPVGIEHLAAMLIILLAVYLVRK